jgi:RNA polymerase sigma-70 factor (ECF subfamily)
MLVRGLSRLFSSSHPRPSDPSARPRGGTESSAPVPAAADPRSPTTSDQAMQAATAQRALVESAARGDRRAAEQLLRALLPRVRNLVRYFVRGDAEVDDLAQESLVTILRSLGSFRGEGNVTSWADRIVVRTVFSHLRRTRKSRKVQVEYTPDVMPVSPNESAQRFLSRREAMRALDALPDEQRDVLVMHHVLGMSAREISEELDAPFETVRSRLRLGMARLRDALDAHEGEVSQ